MRVMLEISSTFGNQTGIGRYSSQLMHWLPKVAPNDKFAFHPNPNTRVAAFRSYCMRLCVPRTRNTSLVRKLVSRKSWFLGGLRWLDKLVPRLANALAPAVKLYTNRYDLYHEPNYLPIGWNHLPTVTTFHDLSIINNPQWHPRDRVKWFEKNLPRSFAQSTQFITDTQAVRQEMIDVLGIPAEKITPVWCGIRSDLRRLDQQEYRPVLDRLALPDGFLLHVGTIEPRKNLLNLMKAYVDLPDALRDRSPLVLVGQWGWNYGDASDYFQTVARHKNVRQIGFVSDDDLPALYSAARALVFPSHYEGFGIPPLEMMGCGGAVIASTNESVREVTAGHAPLIDPLDFTGWRDAMSRAIVDDDWLQTLRRGVVQHARQFTWERTARETLAVYRKVLGIEQPVSIPAKKAA